ncbi:MAG TPA: choice-of-anchor tandem repeat NxxGxxAF-containing protein [Thermoanaerobaculia bacterium]|nr:choice-of-anchor tandem repeat NxxGxxAF-containing protein [Thermoanaerobaculia bacterium]
MTRRSRCLIAGLALSTVASLAAAQTVTFRKIVDTETPVPGGTGTFGGVAPFRGIALRGGQVAFQGEDADGHSGIYVAGGGALRKVADENTPMPGGGGRLLSFFSAPALDAGRVVFAGYTSQTGIEAIFSDLSGSLTTVVGPSTPIPGGSGTFSDLGPGVDVGGGNIVFVGGAQDVLGNLNQQGVYSTLGGFQKIADRNTTVPGGTAGFLGFHDVATDGSVIAFSGTSPGSSGIYRHAGGTLSRVADTSTPIPGGAGSFVGFHGFGLDSGIVAFVASGNLGQNAVYASGPGGALRVVADQFTPVPGSPSLRFASFSNVVSTSQGNVAFVGIPTNQLTLNVEIAGRLITVLRRGGVLDGKVISDLGIDAHSMDGNQIAFRVAFEEGEKAIYVASVGCLPGDTRICLNGGRFAVEATWETGDGEQGAAHGVELTSDTGYLWFFAPSNIEVVVKVLNGCTLSNRYWVFAGGLTDVEVELRITDTVSGETRTYTNPQGTKFQPIQDTSAFATCP